MPNFSSDVSVKGILAYGDSLSWESTAPRMVASSCQIVPMTEEWNLQWNTLVDHQHWHHHHHHPATEGVVIESKLVAGQSLRRRVDRPVLWIAISFCERLYY